MNSDSESTVSLQLDISDNELPVHIGNEDVSDNSSSNDLLQDLDTESEFIQPDIQENDEVQVEEDGSGDDLELFYDHDNLGTNSRSSDEMYDILNEDPEWTQQFSPIHVNQFIGLLGTNFPHDFDPLTASPIDYFQLYFSDDVFQHICDNINKFQKFCFQQKRITSPNYTENFWYDTHLHEMKAYFGLAVMFGLLNQPRYRNFWSKDPFLGNPGVQRVFSLKWYSKLSEYLHVSDREAEFNRAHLNYDKFGRIRWLYYHLQNKFQQMKHPERYQVVDEMIMLYSGRISFIQYNLSWTYIHLDLVYYLDCEIYLNLQFILSKYHYNYV